MRDNEREFAKTTYGEKGRIHLPRQGMSLEQTLCVRIKFNGEGRIHSPRQETSLEMRPRRFRVSERFMRIIVSLKATNAKSL
jgi:hypothetical protein